MAKSHPNECDVSDVAQLAAFRYTENLAAEAPDGMEGHCPWWHGHAIRMAFCAGVAWVRWQPDHDSPEVPQ